MNKGVLQPDILSGCVHCLQCLEGLFARQWKLLSNIVNTGNAHWNTHTLGMLAFWKWRGALEYFLTQKQKSERWTGIWHHFPSAQYCEQVTRFLCFVNSLCGKDNFRWAKPKMSTTEAMNHTVGEQNILCRLRRASFVANKQHKFFQKDNQTGCDSEGSHPNFCEAQKFSFLMSLSQLKPVVLWKHWHQHRRVLCSPLNIVALKIIFVKESHAYSITVLLRLVQGKAICIAVMTFPTTWKLCQMCCSSAKQLASSEAVPACCHILCPVRPQGQIHSLKKALLKLNIFVVNKNLT